MQEIIDVLNFAKEKIDDVSMDLYLLDNPEGDNDEMLRICKEMKRRLNDIIVAIQ